MRETNSDARWLRKLVVACSMLGVVGLGACKADLTAPTAGPVFDMRGGDNRHHHQHDGSGTGRSGSAAMTVSATLLADGSTELTVTTFAASDLDFSTPVGCIKKVQVKVLNGDRHHDDDDDDDRTWTRNFNNLNAGNSYTVRLTNVSLGAQIKVKVLVGCIDRRRTDVVTATGVVVSKPVDLAVTAIRGPGNWPVNVPATILADVAELRGEQGASASCVLYVDNVQVSSVPVSVIAGGTSTCTFTRTFAVVATYELKVALASTRPLDVNASNDSRLGRIDINTANTGGTPSLPVFNYAADVGDITIDDYDSTRTTTWLGLGTAAPNTSLQPDGDVSVVRRILGREQTSVFSGVYYGQLTFGTVGIGLSLSQSVGPASSPTFLHRVTASGLPDNGQGAEPCYRYPDLDGVTYEVCYHAVGFTTLQYSRTTSNTTNYSARIDHTPSAGPECAGPPYPVISRADAATGYYRCYVVNETAAVGTIPTWSTALSFSVTLVTGQVSYSAAPSISLGPLNEPPTPDNTTCTTTTTPAVTSGGGMGGTGGGVTPARTVQTCIRSWLTRTGTVGSATGIGQTTPLQSQ